MSGYKEMMSMPPPYSPGPQPFQPSYAPSGYAPSGYAPAPTAFPTQQQSSNTNVVVVGQPTAPTTTVVHRSPQANDYMVFTVVLFVLCLVHCNLVAVLLLIPALICSLTAQNHNHDGQYASAKQCGELALCCNILVIIKYILLVIAAVVVVILFVTGVLVFAGTAASCTPGCTYSQYTVVQCPSWCN